MWFPFTIGRNGTVRLETSAISFALNGIIRLAEEASMPGDSLICNCAKSSRATLQKTRFNDCHQLEENIDELEAELAEEIEELKLEFDPTTVKLENVVIKPYKKDINIKTTALIWLPYDRDNQKVW